jgi:DNA-directed RNA polymerase subunit H (RpoH/RPB5)
MSVMNQHSINVSLLKIKKKVLCTHAHADEINVLCGGERGDVIKLFRHECVHTNTV